MSRTIRRGRAVAIAAAVLFGATGCAGSALSSGYGSALEAPSPDDYPRPSDETPDGDDVIARLALDDGARTVIWVDPDDVARVVEQHSDPDDPERWTPPRTIYRAGDGCLSLGAATNGTIVAVALGCYETDTFVQQAPDQGVALVSTDLDVWQVEDDLGEFASDPEVSEDGRVRMRNDIYPDRVLLWDDRNGFTAE